jgi:hypothetical protein
MLTESPGSDIGTLSFFAYLQDFKEWRDPDSNRGHHDFQSVYVCAALCRRFLTKGLNKRNLCTSRSA